MLEPRPLCQHNGTFDPFGRCKMEEWRDVPGYEGRYQASSHGRVKSLARINNDGRCVSERILTAREGEQGYFRISLWKDNRRKTFKVAAVVCSAFHGSRPGQFHQVRHLDGIRTNDAATNVAWGTRLENAADALKHGTRARGSRHGNAKLSEGAVSVIRTDSRRAVTIAEQYGVCDSLIRRIKRGAMWAHVE